MQEVKIKKLHQDAIVPTYATDGSACFDLYAIESDFIVGGNKSIIGTGLSFEVPECHAMLIFSRSGHGFNHGARLSNCVGVIDSDYRGEVKIKLTLDEEKEDDVSIDTESAIAQGMIVELPSIELTEVTEELSETERGAGGFGSTDNASVS